METQTETLDASRTGVSQLAQRTPGLVLVWSSQGPTCQPFPITEPTTIGRRGFDAELQLDDRQISRAHCRVSFELGHWHICDLNSRNGTSVDRVAVTNGHWARSFHVLRVGRCLLIPTDDCQAFEPGVHVNDGRVLGPRLQAAWQLIAATSEFSNTLLITGESGAGKEMAARRFHDNGPRPNGPYLAVNCATIPEGVAERLLFGSRKGAFSGAENTQGYLQSADGGTLFLDEAGELDLAIQGKLLRVLETRQVLQLGATKPRAIDIRIVLATHRNLRESVESGSFREDLFFRVARPEVRLPPLRERPEEIPALINLTLQQLSGDYTAHPSLVEICLLRPWPGNIRELITEVRTAAQRAALDQRTTVEARDLDLPAGREFRRSQPHPTTSRPDSDPERTAPVPITRVPSRGHAQQRREQIIAALRQEQGNVARAARLLQVHRTQLRRWIAALKLDPLDFKANPP